MNAARLTLQITAITLLGLILLTAATCLDFVRPVVANRFNLLFIGTLRQPADTILLQQAYVAGEKLIDSAKTPALLARLGRITVQAGNTEHGISLLEQSIEQDRSDPRYFLWLAEAATQSNNLTVAYGALLDGLDYHPNDPHLFELLLQLYDKSHAEWLGDRQAMSSSQPSQESLQGSAILSLPDLRPRWLTLPGVDSLCPFEPDSICELGATGFVKLESPGFARYVIDSSDRQEISIGCAASIGASCLECKLPMKATYILNSEVFTDFLPTDWAALPHKALGPNESYTTYLYSGIPSQYLNVGFLNLPHSYLDVYVDDQLVANLVGDDSSLLVAGQRPDNVIRLDNDTQGLTKVTLTSPPRANSNGAAVTSISFSQQPADR